MSEREDDLDAELEELVDTDEYPDVEEVGSLTDLESDLESDAASDLDADLEAEVGDLGPESGRDSIKGTSPVGSTTTEHTRTASEEPGRVRSWLGSLFSTHWFAAAAIANGVGVVAAGAIPLPFTGYLGVFLAGAAIGLAGSERRYLEVAAAGALAAGLGTFFDAIALVLLAVGLPFVAIAAVLGAVVGAFGHYAGRDLRHGLTREI